MSSNSLQPDENSQKRKSDIPVAVVKPIEKKKRRKKNCLLCSVHGTDIAVTNHNRYCKYMQDIKSGAHWCIKCNYVFQRRINMAILTQQKRNRDKDYKKLNGQLDKDEIFPEANKQDASFISEIYFKMIAKMQERQKKGNGNPLSKDELLDICNDKNNPDKLNDFMMEACNSNSSISSSKSTKTSGEDAGETNKPMGPSLKSKPANEISNATHEDILIKTWEMLSHPDYYSMLSKMSVYSWFYLIMKENNGDVNSAMNMIIKGSRQSGEFNHHLKNITSSYDKAAKPMPLPAQLQIQTAYPRSAIPLENLGRHILDQKVLYNDRFDPETSRSFTLPSPYHLSYANSPYYLPFNLEQYGPTNLSKNA